MTTAPPLKKQPVPFGKYLLLDRVNIGGMAEVWRGKRFGLGGFEQLVAIKRILPNIAEDSEFIRMFITEAKITAQLAHANIARVYELGNMNSAYFIAMEYISGKDLRALFDRARKREEAMPVGLVCYILARVCEGLDYAHRKRDGQGRDMNIVHRDVSPQNVLISYDGEVKLIDFGIAKVANRANETQAGILKGKFSYMSPEQVSGNEVDRRSDIFAAGICLYEMLTNERLFVGETDFSVLEKVRAAEVEPPSRKNPAVSPELDRIVLKALAKKVDERYEFSNELAEELQRFLTAQTPPVTRKDLSQFMAGAFDDELEREKGRLQEYSDVKAPESMLAALERPSPAVPPPARPISQDIPVSRTETDYPLPSERAREAGPPRISPVLEPPPKLASGVVPSAATDAGPTEITQGRPEPSVTRANEPMPHSSDSSDLLPAMQSEESGFGGTPVPVPTVALRPEGARRSYPEASVPVPRSVVTPRRAMRPLTWTRWLPPPDSPQRRVLLGLAALVVLFALLTTYLLVRKPSMGYVYLELPAAARSLARVNINGEDLGERRDWPLVHRTQAGKSLVVVTAAGFKAFRATVNVKEGAETTQVPIVLERELGQQQLLVLAQPEEAKVTVNGQVLKEEGVTGAASVVTLPVGSSALIEVSASGHRPFRETVEVRASAKPDAPQVVRAALEPEYVEVRVTSDPPGATVLMAGREVGRTPATIQARGSHVELLLRKRCFVEQRVPLELDGRASEAVDVALKRSPSCR